jgi:hypothetical protein
MKSAARIVTMGLIGLIIFISACSQDKDYSQNFSTPNDAPMGFYDIAKYEKGVFTGIGWAADKEDGAPLKKILVYVDGKAVGEAKYYTDRSDVVSMYKNDRWLKSGWRVSEKIPLNKGLHSSMALIYDNSDALKVAAKDFKVE